MDSYLASKGLHQPFSRHGLRESKGPFNGYEPFEPGEVSLLIPVLDVAGKVWSLQFISPDGEKRFFPGGKLRGHFFPIGLIDNSSKILITEGIATALTLHEDTQQTVIVAFNCGNLATVAEQVRWKYPDAEILICGDNDHATEGNPGRTKAIEAAARCGGDWVVPDFTGLNAGPKDTDFNDLYRLKEQLLQGGEK